MTDEEYQAAVGALQDRLLNDRRPRSSFTSETMAVLIELVMLERRDCEDRSYSRDLCLRRDIEKLRCAVSALADLVERSLPRVPA